MPPSFLDPFASLHPGRWEVRGYTIGRSECHPANVFCEDGNLRLMLRMNTFGGAAITSRELFSYGRFRAVMRTAPLAFANSGFFLYKEPDFASEIDFEVFPSQLWMSSYANGSYDSETVDRFPYTPRFDFDPSASFHLYEILWLPTRIDFSVDGILRHTKNFNIPTVPMNVHFNVWYPVWKGEQKPFRPEYFTVSSFEYQEIVL